MGGECDTNIYKLCFIISNNYSCSSDSLITMKTKYKYSLIEFKPWSFNTHAYVSLSSLSQAIPSHIVI